MPAKKRTPAKKKAAADKARKTREANIPKRARRLGVSTATYRRYLKAKSELAKKMLAD